MDLTMQDFFQGYVLPILNESQDEDSYEEFWLPCGNVILQACFDANNGLRRKAELLPLTSFTELDADDSLEDWDQELLLECIVYGWAASLIVDDTNDDGVNKYNILEDKYQAGLARYGMFGFATVVSDYGI